MYTNKYVCVYARSLTPNHILSYLPQLSRLISTTGNWACYDGVYLCNVHKPVVPCAHPLAAQCNVRFVLSSFNPRTMPSPFPCIIELKPVETVKSPRAKFKCKGPRRNDKPKKNWKENKWMQQAQLGSGFDPPLQGGSGVRRVRRDMCSNEFPELAGNTRFDLVSSNRLLSMFYRNN